MTHDAVKLFNPDRLTVDDPIEVSARAILFRAELKASELPARLFILLWRRAGGKPDRSAISIREVHAELGGSESNVRVALRSLAKRELISLPEGRLRGEFEVGLLARPPREIEQQLLFDVPAAGDRPRFEVVDSPRGDDESATPLRNEIAQRADDCATPLRNDVAQRPPAEVLELQRTIERKRSQAFASRDSAAQRVPACDVLRSQISVSVSSETKNRDLDRPRDFAQKLPSGLLPKPPTDSYAAGLSLESLVRKIQQDVGPRLQQTVAAKVAEAIHSGHLDGDRDVLPTIRRAHDLVASGQCESPFVYFVGAMRKKFGEVGLPWDRRSRGRSTARGP